MVKTCNRLLTVNLEEYITLLLVTEGSTVKVSPYTAFRRAPPLGCRSPVQSDELS